MPISASILRLAASLIAIGLADAALAQDKPDNWLTRLFQLPATAPVPATGGPHEWSGQAGASGHPLMTADAIREAAAEFGNCVAGLWRRAALARRHPAETISSALPRASRRTCASWTFSMPSRNSPNRPLGLSRRAGERRERIARGRELLAQYAQVFDAVERTYGVDRHIVTAIWGVESNYGTMGGDRPVIRSTATLACVGRRRDYFREGEFLSALEILQRGDVAPPTISHRLLGQRAFGPTQFMPTSFKRYAVDFDRDGRRDVVDSVADLIASTANNLKMDGWAGVGRAGATRSSCRRISIISSPTVRGR